MLNRINRRALLQLLCGVPTGTFIVEDLVSLSMANCCLFDKKALNEDNTLVRVL